MKYLLTLLLAGVTLALSSQSTGRIVFEEKMDLHKNLPPERAEFKDMIPQFNVSNFELYFTADKSVYRAKKEVEDTEVSSESGGMRMSMRFGRDNRVVFKNLTDNLMVDSREFMQKQFLIKGVPTERKWKIGMKQKEILGHACFSASYQADTATHIVAWFAPTLAVQNGPADFQGLPGMILQIDINDGTRVTTATEISFEEVDPAILTEPTKGKEVTAEEFEAIREEKMKEMGGQPGGGRHMIMIRQ